MSSSNTKQNLQETSVFWKSIRPFLIGGLSGSSATCCIQPIDMVKVRIQLQGEGTSAVINRNPLSVGKQIIATDGVTGLYKGLSAAILRQLTYGLTRLGMYRTLTNKFTPEGKTAADIPFYMTLLFSLTAGGIGALIGTPADAALVRMQADATLPEELKRGYKNAFDALIRMAREEGLAGFFAGASPTIARGLAINVGMLTTYDPTKKFLGRYFGRESQTNRFVSGAFSGWVAATVSLPFDFVKTRIQKDKGTYNGFFDCITKVLKSEGPLAFYKGYGTFCIRITPHIMLTWVFMDNYKALMSKFGV